MKLLARTLLFSVLFAALLICGCGGSATDNGSPRPDFQAWSTLGDIDWRIDADVVEAGPIASIRPPEGAGYLVSGREFADFTLTVEFWIEDDTNSGVFIRCVDPELIDADTCYEINIWDSHPVQEYRTGSIVKLAVPIAHVETIGRWNRLRIEASGDTIVASVNETLTARLTDQRSANGVVSLQYGGAGVLRFRNLRIEPL